MPSRKSPEKIAAVGDRVAREEHEKFGEDVPTHAERQTCLVKTGVETIETIRRQRNDLVQAAGRHIQRMQKALTQMNIQLANVLSDVSGMTGQAIVQAILAGERNPHKLAEFRDPRVQASEQEIARSLEGNWQGDLLFVLKQEQDGYEFCQKQMLECDRQVEQYLQQREDRSKGAPELLESVFLRPREAGYPTSAVPARKESRTCAPTIQNLKKKPEPVRGSRIKGANPRSAWDQL
jgi:DNA-binding protein YbaB